MTFVAFRFILPPPAALLFWPLGFFDGKTAHWLWLLGQTAAAWGVAVQAGMLSDRCTGKRSCLSGILTLGIALHPLVYQSIGVSNISPLIGLLIGSSVIALIENNTLSGAAAVTFGAGAKYATAALIPLIVALRRWSMLLWSALFTVAWGAVALLIEGIGPFREFITSIAPTLARSHEHIDNVSIRGVILRFLHITPPLPQSWQTIIMIAQALTLILILLLIFRQGRSLAGNAPNICAASAALILWMMIFSPVCWSHYSVYVAPLLGWLLWEAKQSAVRAVMATAIGVLITVKSSSIDPMNAHLFLAMLIMLALAMGRLAGAVDYAFERADISSVKTIRRQVN